MLPKPISMAINNFVRWQRNRGNECFIWDGLVDSSGFPWLWYSPTKTKYLAHRVAFELFCEGYDPKLLVLQTCKNRLCLRPEHLYQAAHSKNRNPRGKRLKETDLIKIPEFMDKFHKMIVEGKDCWDWSGRFSKSNYGVIDQGYHSYFVHRISYTYHIGEIPNELNVLHSCDNPPCSNPKHLFVGTDKDNSDDMKSKNRQRKGETSPVSILTEDQVRDIRSRYTLGGTTMQKLADEYNVSHTAVCNIITRTNWKHIKD